ncbi:type II toxin-antitoxin system HicA family toxin [Candidatus Gracilibacteria bacterium]|nr:type II toxin-antitoxin system HicA family toxin [Candidatus Gracilibacteria bacterium]
MKPRELVKLLEENNFFFVRQTGSHAIYKKFGHKLIIVPIHNRDIPTGTLKAILKDASLK